ncbi:hypothetical protein DFH06DRAFT_1384349 [Mycena polygramma]|nr:hypothetical protein DFH06DRAFT_1384349 [Mycena polygramma]
MYTSGIKAQKVDDGENEEENESDFGDDFIDNRLQIDDSDNEDISSAQPARFLMDNMQAMDADEMARILHSRYGSRSVPEDDQDDGSFDIVRWIHTAERCPDVSDTPVWKLTVARGREWDVVFTIMQLCLSTLRDQGVLSATAGPSAAGYVYVECSHISVVDHLMRSVSFVRRNIPPQQLTVPEFRSVLVFTDKPAIPVGSWVRYGKTGEPGHISRKKRSRTSSRPSQELFLPAHAGLSIHPTSAFKFFGKQFQFGFLILDDVRRRDLVDTRVCPSFSEIALWEGSPLHQLDDSFSSGSDLLSHSFSRSLHVQRALVLKTRMLRIDDPVRLIAGSGYDFLGHVLAFGDAGTVDVRVDDLSRISEWVILSKYMPVLPPYDVEWVHVQLKSYSPTSPSTLPSPTLLLKSKADPYSGIEVRVCGASHLRGLFGTVKNTSRDGKHISVLTEGRAVNTVDTLPVDSVIERHTHLTLSDFVSASPDKKQELRKKHELKRATEARPYFDPLDPDPSRVALLPSAAEAWPEVAGPSGANSVVPSIHSLLPDPPTLSPPRPTEPFINLPSDSLEGVHWLLQPALRGRYLDVSTRNASQVHNGRYDRLIGVIESLPEVKRGRKGSVQVKFGLVTGTLRFMKIETVFPLQTNEFEGVISRDFAQRVLDVMGVYVVVIGPDDHGNDSFVGKIGFTTHGGAINIDGQLQSFPIGSICRSDPYPKQYNARDFYLTNIDTDTLDYGRHRRKLEAREARMSNISRSDQMFAHKRPAKPPASFGGCEDGAPVPTSGDADNDEVEIVDSNYNSIPGGRKSYPLVLSDDSDNEVQIVDHDYNPLTAESKRTPIWVDSDGEDSTSANETHRQMSSTVFLSDLEAMSDGPTCPLSSPISLCPKKVKKKDRNAAAASNTDVISKYFPLMPASRGRVSLYRRLREPVRTAPLSSASAGPSAAFSSVFNPRMRLPEISPFAPSPFRIPPENYMYTSGNRWPRARALRPEDLYIGAALRLSQTKAEAARTCCGCCSPLVLRVHAHTYQDDSMSIQESHAVPCTADGVREYDAVLKGRKPARLLAFFSEP